MFYSVEVITEYVAYLILLSVLIDKEPSKSNK